MLQNLYFKFFFIILILFFYKINLINAKDLGKFGNIFEIQEEDLLDVIDKKLKNINIEQWQKEFQEQARKSINRPNGVKLEIVKKYKIYYFDPSIILQKDYKDNRGVVFARKGTKINPLDKFSLNNDLLFIDGDYEEQMNYALNYFNEKKGKVKIILVNGSVIDLMNKYNIRFYFDQNQILINKLKINKIPTLVTQEEYKLKIEEILL